MIGQKGLGESGRGKFNNEPTEEAATCHRYIKSRIKGMGDKTTAFLLRDVAWDANSK